MVSGRRNRQRRCSATTRLPRRPTTPWTTGSVLAVVLLPPRAHALKDLALGTDLPYNGQPLGIKPQIVADNSHHSSLKRSFLKVSKYLDRDVDAGRSRSDNDTVASSNRTINRYSAVMGLPFQSSHASTTSQSTSSPTIVPKRYAATNRLNGTSPRSELTPRPHAGLGPWPTGLRCLASHTDTQHIRSHHHKCKCISGSAALNIHQLSSRCPPASSLSRLDVWKESRASFGVGWFIDARWTPTYFCIPYL